MKYTPDYIRNLKPYVAGKTIAEVVAQYQPKRIAKLASNENRLGCSPKVRTAVEQAMQQIQDYPDPAAQKLTSALAAKYNVEPEQVLCCSGSEGVMSLFTRAFLQEGDHVLTADVTFIGFTVLANIQGADIERVPLGVNFRFDLEAIARRIRPDTKCVYLANPNNPTGTYVNRAELQEFLSQVPTHVLVILDEAYFEYARSLDDYPNGLDFLGKNVFVFRTFSKAYGLAGLRIGFGIGDAEWMGIMRKIKPPFEPSAVAQAAGIAALEDEAFLARSIELVAQQKERLYAMLEKAGLSFVSSASNSVMVVFGDEHQARVFTQSMLEKGVILRQLGGFGLPNAVRITVGLVEEMDYVEKCLGGVSFP